MFEWRSARVSIIFSLWFLVAAVIPSLFVVITAYKLQRHQYLVSAQHELQNVSRLKEGELRLLVETNFDLVSAYARQVDTFAQLATNTDSLITTFLNNIGEEAIVYVVDSGGNFYLPESEFSDPFILWNPVLESPQTSSDRLLYFTEHLAFFARRVSQGWIILARPQEHVNTVLHNNINDSRFFSKLNQQDTSYGIGRTADIFLLSNRRELISRSLMMTPQEGRELQQFATRLLTSKQSIHSAGTSFAGREVLFTARRTTIDNETVVLVATLDRSEVLQSFQEQQQSILAVYLASLATVLIVLYLFIGSLTTMLIKPIYTLVVDLIDSSIKLKQSISTTEQSMRAQEQVAARLTKSYKNQLRDIRAVDKELNEIVSSLAQVSKQTRMTATSVQQIDTRAKESQGEARDAQASIKNIRQLSIAHRSLIESLERYSEHVDAISSNVKKLSQAIGYLSLNASIETGKSDTVHRSLSSLVSEVGRLSRMSDVASEQITSLVKSIRAQLLQTKAKAASEQHAAESSLRIIHQALGSLQKISKDTTTIAQGVVAVDKQVSRQTSSAQTIAAHAGDVTQDAKKSVADADHLNRLARDLAISIQANVSVVRKLAANSTRLKKLFGVHERKQ